MKAQEDYPAAKIVVKEDRTTTVYLLQQMYNSLSVFLYHSFSVAG